MTVLDNEHLMLAHRLSFASDGTSAWDTECAWRVLGVFACYLHGNGWYAQVRFTSAVGAAS